MKKVLECHSRGDKRFSALYAKVKRKGDLRKKDYLSIETLYQGAKIIENNKITGIFVNQDMSVMYPVEMLTGYYYTLWFMYFEQNRGLLEVISEYDEFVDIFRRKNTVNCQADCIKEMKRLGLRGYHTKYVKPFMEDMKTKGVRIF